MNITKQTQTHRYREQTSGYQWGAWWRDKSGAWGKHTNTTIYNR